MLSFRESGPLAWGCFLKAFSPPLGSAFVRLDPHADTPTSTRSAGASSSHIQQEHSEPCR